VAVGLHVHTQHDLAPTQHAAKELAQRRLERAEFVGKTEIEIEKTAVDRAQLHRHAGRLSTRWSSRWRIGISAGFGGRADARSGAGITGHAVDCHAAFPPENHSIMSKPKPAPLPSGTVVGGYQIIKKL